MGELNKKFKDAVHDLVYLLERGYPKRSAITLVGNRYRLDSAERMILYRGVFRRDEAETRKNKLRDCSEEVVQKLAVDGYNVLITLESYLLGRTIFRSLDGFVRDIAGVYGNFTFSEMTRRSAALLAGFVDIVRKASGIEIELIVYLDAPVSKSGELAAYMRGFFLERGIESRLEVVHDPDVRLIAEGTSGAVATSDTVIGDRVEILVDIPGYIIIRMLRKHVLDLQQIHDGLSGGATAV
jgi:hypothetical protein